VNVYTYICVYAKGHGGAGCRRNIAQSDSAENVYMYVYVYVYTYTYMQRDTAALEANKAPHSSEIVECVYVQSYLYTCIYICMRVYICINMYAYMYVCICTHKRTRAHTHMYVHTN